MLRQLVPTTILKERMEEADSYNQTLLSSGHASFPTSAKETLLNWMGRAESSDCAQALKVFSMINVVGVAHFCTLAVIIHRKSSPSRSYLQPQPNGALKCSDLEVVM